MIIENIMYLMTCIKSDIAHAICVLSICTNNQNINHCNRIIRLILYFRYNHSYELHYKRHSTVIKSYRDANWIMKPRDSNSTIEFVFTLGGKVVSWKSSKQTTMDKCVINAKWLHHFLEHIPKWSKLMSSICIYCDDQSMIIKAQSHMQW